MGDPRLHDVLSGLAILAGSFTTRIDLGVAYGTDLFPVRRVLQEAS